MENNPSINLYWMGTSAELEKGLLPIRFPVYRGLLGHRIFIINKKDQGKFDEVKSLADLQKYKGAQGIGWSDIDILEKSGLSQHTAKYENIFKMVNKGGRIDYFSRGVSEAFVEVEARISKYPNLAVEQKVLLVYPFAMYFFTSHANKELAQTLEKGFAKAYEDGSFMEYFNNAPDIVKIFKQSKMESRVRIEIPNALMTKETLGIPNKYWHGK